MEHLCHVLLCVRRWLQWNIYVMCCGYEYSCGHWYFLNCSPNFSTHTHTHAYTITHARTCTQTVLHPLDTMRTRKQVKGG